MGLGASEWGWGLLCGDGDPPDRGQGAVNGAGGVRMGLGALMWGWRPPRLRAGGTKWGWGRQNEGEMGENGDGDPPNWGVKMGVETLEVGGGDGIWGGGLGGTGGNWGGTGLLGCTGGNWEDTGLYWEELGGNWDVLGGTGGIMGGTGL